MHSMRFAQFLRFLKWNVRCHKIVVEIQFVNLQVLSLARTLETNITIQPTSNSIKDLLMKIVITTNLNWYQQNIYTNDPYKASYWLTTTSNTAIHKWSIKLKAENHCHFYINKIYKHPPRPVRQASRPLATNYGWDISKEDAPVNKIEASTNPVNEGANYTWWGTSRSTTPLSTDPSYERPRRDMECDITSGIHTRKQRHRKWHISPESQMAAIMCMPTLIRHCDRKQDEWGNAHRGTARISTITNHSYFFMY